MKNNYRILFMGTPDFALPALEALKAHGYMPIALYTQPDRINGRGKKINFSPVKSFGLANDIPVFQPTTLKSEEEQQKIRDLAPDLIIVIAYGKILPKAVLDIPTYGAINVHASLLPEYRGLRPSSEPLSMERRRPASPLCSWTKAWIREISFLSGKWIFLPT